jgi:hypothetical protein
VYVGYARKAAASRTGSKSEPPPPIEVVESQTWPQIARRTAGVSILEIEGGKVRRFMAYFDTRDLASQVVD